MSFKCRGRRTCRRGISSWFSLERVLWLQFLNLSSQHRGLLKRLAVQDLLLTQLLLNLLHQILMFLGIQLTNLGSQLNLETPRRRGLRSLQPLQGISDSLLPAVAHELARETTVGLSLFLYQKRLVPTVALPGAGLLLEGSSADFPVAGTLLKEGLNSPRSDSWKEYTCSTGADLRPVTEATRPRLPHPECCHTETFGQRPKNRRTFAVEHVYGSVAPSSVFCAKFFVSPSGPRTSGSFACVDSQEPLHVRAVSFFFCWEMLLLRSVCFLSCPLGV